MGIAVCSAWYVFPDGFLQEISITEEQYKSLETNPDVVPALQLAEGAKFVQATSSPSDLDSIQVES